MDDCQLLELRKVIRSEKAAKREPDRQTRRLLNYLFTSTRGGLTRLRVITVLLDKPCNTHQLAQALGMDYKSIQHHINVLEKNNLVSRMGQGYGAPFRLSTFLEINILALDEAIDILERKASRKKVYL